MNNYRQSLILNARPADVYAALTTAQGLRGWWSQDCDGNAGQVGATIAFRFGIHYKDMRVEHLEATREVRWLCTRAHICSAQLTRSDEWVGTQIVFRVSAHGDDARLDFEHVGLVPELECFSMCNRGWQHFMRSLQQFVETGRGTPYELAAAIAA